ncbi:CaiB/BaiF CoA-transferase family protein [Roseomonas sp. KE0001]|uniref:CaiB/BaiF CoA transferase family protein n=1 Tax=Roseomonas sp. KE0001 TaxID=2479201 RepID=UPI0018E008FD|nr:CaiB/BaiF CoA-transferase family protein [Roseomonas sp. KE0001]MBI0434459.1 CoA transferase [Roseomonas sp. KE0001]
MTRKEAAGPLAGLCVVEMAGIGPGPLAAMLLADLGAEVTRIDRPAPPARLMPLGPAEDMVGRGRREVALDLKSPTGVAAALDLIGGADALIEGFRPGVMERLGLGPEPCLARNPRLVYGRMTGWGQDGPLAQAAGHDLNYLSLTGLLAAIGRPGERPVPPLNLVADYGGGAMFLVMGLLAALLERERSGQGQVVDAAMTDGAAALATAFYGLRAAGRWSLARGDNLLDGGAPFYDTYETADGRHLAVACLEAPFFAEMARRIGLDARFVERQRDRAIWPEMRAEMTRIFLRRSRAEWVALLEGSDACVTGVLDMDEAPHHPHNRARGLFQDRLGHPCPAPAPRFSRTPGRRAGE